MTSVGAGRRCRGTSARRRRRHHGRADRPAGSAATGSTSRSSTSTREHLQRAMAANRQWLDRRVEKGRLERAEADAAARPRDRRRPTSPARPPKSAWAIEAVVELPSVKREIFAELDAHLPARAGIATNSSNIVVSRLADATARPELCCNMHFFHPVLVMDLCEVVRGPETSDETCARAVAWSQTDGPDADRRREGDRRLHRQPHPRRRVARGVLAAARAASPRRRTSTSRCARG